MRANMCMDSPGTYAWIMFQDGKNRTALGEIPSFDELFAKSALPQVMARTFAAQAETPAVDPKTLD